MFISPSFTRMAQARTSYISRWW